MRTFKGFIDASVAKFLTVHENVRFVGRAAPGVHLGSHHLRNPIKATETLEQLIPTSRS
jgi:hypothetical protein